MTDQPQPEKGGTPEGYQPPSYIPGQEPGAPYGQPAPRASRPEETFGPTPHAAPQQPYAPPPFDANSTPSYGQQPYGTPAPYGQQGGPFNAYGQPAYYGVPPEPKGMSIASLCCGIATYIGLGVFILPQLAAVILGHLALRREPAGKGMAIAGLVLGYVGIALTILVVVLLAVAFSFSASSGSTRYGT